DLPRARHLRRLATDTDPAALPPLQLSDTLWIADARDGGKERLGDGALVERAESRVHQQHDPRLAVGPFVLDELIVRGSAAEARRQDLIEHGRDVDVVQRDAAGVELLEALDL